jgi:glycine cleavage system H protein
VYSPVAGTVAERNEALANDPGLINRTPYTEGWIVKLSGVSASEIAGLMSADEYKKLVNR